ncbi:MAG: hypothetical protein ACE5GV_06800, partial [Candidatus Scalindua sp.]
MIIKKLSFTFIILFFFTCLTISTVGHCGQTAEVEDLTSIRTNLLNDVEKILGGHDQDIAQLESDLNILKDVLRKLQTMEKKFIEGKMGGDILDLTTRQQKILEERIRILNETIQVRTEKTEIAGNMKKTLEATTTLSGRKNKINEEASLLPGSQFASFQKEAELLEANLESILAKAREKETHLLTLQTMNDAVSLSLKDQKKKLLEEVKELVNQKPETEEESILIDNKKRLLENELKLRDDKIKLLFMQTELAKLETQSTQVQRLNLELEKEIKTEIAGILSLKFKEEEIQRKEKEAEETKRTEEEIRRIAEEEKAKAELEKREALKQAEIAVQKRLEETSPERKRILEIEAELHKQEGLIATIKDELITVGTERHKYLTEFKKILENIDELLGGENTPDEIAGELDVITAESKRIQNKVETIQSRLSASEKQKAIIDESLEKIRAELVPIISGEKSKIEKESEGFSNKAQGEKLVELANMRLKLIEEQKKLVEKKIERGNEVLESGRELLKELADAQESLSQIRAANVWARRESRISTDTVIKGVTDIKALKERPFDFYKASVQNLKKLRIYLADTKNIPAFIIKVIIVVFVIFFTFFARRILNKWAEREIERFTAVSPHTFFRFELVPGLLRIMQHTLTMFFLFVIALTISLTIPSNAPVILSAIYGFAILSVYKFLRGTVVESLSPYTGVRRWIPITYSSARHIFKGLNVILLFSTITITLILVLNTYGYKKDVIELLWFIYRIVTISLAVWIAASQRSVLLKMLPYYESAIGKLVNKVINFLYPVLIAFVILLFAIRSLGYALLTYTFVVTLIKSVIVSIIAYAVYRFLLRRLSLSQERKLKLRRQLDDEEFESEKISLNVGFRIYKGLLDYGILIIAVVIIFGMWNNTFKYVVSSPAAPTLFRNVYENILYVFVSIKNALTYKFTLAEGRYTTPFKML